MVPATDRHHASIPNDVLANEGGDGAYRNKQGTLAPPDLGYQHGKGITKINKLQDEIEFVDPVGEAAKITYLYDYSLFFWTLWLKLQDLVPIVLEIRVETFVELNVVVLPRDVSPLTYSSLKFVLIISKRPEHETQPVEREADHRDAEGQGERWQTACPSRSFAGKAVPATNGKRKRMIADVMLNNVAMKD